MLVLFSKIKFLTMFGTALLVIGFIFATLPVSELYAESLVEKAKKEGMVTFYSGLIIPDTQAVGDAFTKKYPFIKFEFYRGNQRKILQKVLMEKIRANLLPVRPVSPEETTGYMKDYDDIKIHPGGALISVPGYERSGLFDRV